MKPSDANSRAEPLALHRLHEGKEEERVAELLHLVGLARLAAGRPVACAIEHADGAAEELSLIHSYTDAQLGWFRAGSALNAIAR